MVLLAQHFLLQLMEVELVVIGLLITTPLLLRVVLVVAVAAEPVHIIGLVVTPGEEEIKVARVAAV